MNARGLSASGSLAFLALLAVSGARAYTLLSYPETLRGPTSPGPVSVSSDIMRRSFSATR